MYLRPLEEGAAVDELYHACHAYNDYGDDYAEIFVTMISEV
jgi:hypothetical protein